MQEEGIYIPRRITPDKTSDPSSLVNSGQYQMLQRKNAEKSSAVHYKQHNHKEVLPNSRQKGMLIYDQKHKFLYPLQFHLL